MHKQYSQAKKKIIEDHVTVNVHIVGQETAGTSRHDGHVAGFQMAVHLNAQI